ncbi:MAG: hypothetical protein COT89_01045 [Candidatus Colwellbacteria bacterium CG10_big_fil_rev_8_21_14_0_10_42_22]|uniref:Thioredoxin domain-containing protein n=1 Tax=Candidatus Colwellbacteria bacterium CG10_big_fil_rev_8_21_14_0_10_42_22 TaxID=1974540 RepID=A0A2H0VG67_9BACT|nr:MAG: hypothetical protein COT89_01045 [Candidatus Colwellbacteria bacterium CG10_big_fil_rev_8_21_14_0_10_42_22]
MKKTFLGLFIASSLISTSGVLSLVNAAQGAEINFFFSETCPHCIREQGFLDDLQREYGNDLIINRYSKSDWKTESILKDFIRQYDADEEALVFVPITFVGSKYFVGFDDASGDIGQGIRSGIESQFTVGSEPSSEPTSGESKTFNLPLFGNVNVGDYSLPILAIIMGTLDGFNVCSLGALILILGLTLQFKSRKKILLYGGLFLITTAIVYGILIQLWYELFSVFQEYLNTLSLLIGLLGFIGGVYFFKEFIRMRRIGMACKATGTSFVNKIMQRTEEVFSKPNRLLYLALAVIAFAGVVAVLEFPCSAVIPVAFAGIMADMGVSGVEQFFLLSLFIFFYVLDEFLIFTIAAWQMKIVLTSPKLTVWATFIESVLLFALGAYYLSSLI